MKKMVALLLVLTMFFCVTGCAEELSDLESSSEQNNVASENNNATVENFKIDSLDKLNYYAVKKAIAENDIELLNTSSQTEQAVALQSNSDAEVLNLAKTTASKIDSNSTFTITMYTYFTITLGASNGFLAQKLGGTGTVEVVITKNNFNNMITFKKGDKYFSCFETYSTSGTMSFSSSKYAKGYYLIENNDTSSCEYTVYFEGDRVLDFNSAVYQKSGGSALIADKIKFNNDFSIVLHKKQSFTPKQLEILFSSNDQSVDNNSNLNGENIIYEEASLTDKSVDFKNSSGISIITNKHINKVIAMENEKFGFCIKLDLKSDIDILGKKSVDLYIKDIIYNSFFIQKDSDAVYIIDLNNTTRMYDVFYKLTTMNDDNKIGKIITYNDFMKQMSKKIDFNEYDIKIQDFCAGFDYETDYFVYTYDSIEQDKNIEYNPSNYDITIDGITITIPIKVSDLIDKGFVLTNDSSFNQQLLAGGADLCSPKGKLLMPI